MNDLDAAIVMLREGAVDANGNVLKALMTLGERDHHRFELVTQLCRDIESGSFACTKIMDALIRGDQQTLEDALESYLEQKANERGTPRYIDADTQAPFGMQW